VPEQKSKERPKARRTRVSLASLALFPGIFLLGTVILALVFVPMMIADRRNERILREGVPAKARVTDIVPTGSHHNEDPEVVLSLEVTPAQGKPFASTVETHMSVVYLPRFQPGSIVNVRFDPKKPEDVALVIP
jgi:hypothetical protein